MPLYDFSCPECEKVGEAFVPLERLDKEVIVCADCGRQAIRLFAAPKGGDLSEFNRKHNSIRGWYDESLNKIFHSQGEKKRYLKEKGFTQIDGVHGIKKEVRRQYYHST